MDIDKLKNLHGKCSNCKTCVLHENGHKPPTWYHNSLYALFMEQPSNCDEESMKTFWKIGESFNLKPEQFMHIHSIQCRPFVSKRKTRRRPTIPSKFHRSECRSWVYAYLEALAPQKMLALGNVVMEELTGDFDGIIENNGRVVTPKYGPHLVPTVLCISPSAMRFNKDAEELIRYSLQKFKDI